MPRPLIDDRRGRLLRAAGELIVERGWPRTTIADVATKAGVGKGAVYLEFPTKTALLDALVRERTKALTARVRERVTASIDPVDLAAVYRFAAEALLDDQLMSALYLGDEAVLGSHVAEIDDGRYQERFVWLTDYAHELQAAGVVDSRVQAADLVRVLSVFTIGLLHAARVFGQIGSAELSSTITLFGELVARGLSTSTPTDHEAARRAQLGLLDALDGQLHKLEARA
ncbi:TetR/AcrR family transcriptional regulator [Pseudoclavibacter helvolus]|uniref:TetR/AcrR family transcriptional regulator n=1 Tax=Pseudoclavibacter helvolus TaxID=255205 RepID=UPI003C78744D